MTIDERNILWLDLFEFLTYHKKVKILSVFEKGTDIKKSFLSNIYLKDILTQLEITKMSLLLDDSYLDKEIEKYKNQNINLITIYHSLYPQKLKEIATPPLCLYCKGNVQLLNSLCIGIVGSRKPSEYGLLVTKQYTKSLCENDITVVSGLAIGVDTIAHKTVLEEHGNTIAVLAGGFNHIYPSCNINLSKNIMENNLIITENAPNTVPVAYLFPIRNRIIAGLCDAVVITEANEKSGSIHTADYAFDFNREVFAVPGRINSPLSMGTNKLIKANRAWITLHPDDVLQELNIAKKENQQNEQIQLDINQQIIIDYIGSEKKSFQQIAEQTNLSASELNALLLEMEIDGLILKLANNSYIKA